MIQQRRDRAERVQKVGSGRSLTSPRIEPQFFEAICHLVYAAHMDDERIIEERIRGRSVRAIARAHNVSVAEVNDVIDRWVDSAIDDKTRKTNLCLELARLDELQMVFHTRALQGDVPSGALVARLIERRCVILGLSTP